MTSPSSSPAVRASASADSNAPAIECQALVKHYGSKVAVAGIDLVVQRGQCFGLLGPNGAGKTTTVEMLEGLHPPTSGTIRIFGARWGEGRDQWIRERFGVQLQDTQLADKLTVEEVLTLFRGRSSASPSPRPSRARPICSSSTSRRPASIPGHARPSGASWRLFAALAAPSCSRPTTWRRRPLCATSSP